MCGVRQVIGSWNTMPTRAPRTRSSSASASPSSSVPPSSARPLARPLALSSPSAPRNSWLLPAPDSPTTPKHSPACHGEIHRPHRLHRPRPRWRSARRSPPGAAALRGRRVSAHADPVHRAGIAEQVQAQQQRHQHRCGHQQHPRRGLHLLRAAVDQVAEACLRLLHPEAEESSGSSRTGSSAEWSGRRRPPRARADWARRVAQSICAAAHPRGARRVDELAAP